MACWLRLELISVFVESRKQSTKQGDRTNRQFIEIHIPGFLVSSRNMVLCLVRRRKRKLEGICGLGGHRAKCLALSLSAIRSTVPRVVARIGRNIVLWKHEFIWIYMDLRTPSPNKIQCPSFVGFPTYYTYYILYTISYIVYAVNQTAVRGRLDLFSKAYWSTCCRQRRAMCLVSFCGSFQSR